MADAASAIIGIVAFGLHAAHKVYEVIDSIKDAPADVLALKHDAKEIGSLLLQLQQSRILDSAVIPPSGDMTILKKRFEGAMDEVALFVDRVAEERRDGEIRVKKLQWFLKGGRCEKLGGSLASLKTSIIAIIAASTSQSVDAVQALVIRLVEAQEESSSTIIDAFKRDHESWVAQQVAELASLRETVEERMAILAYNQDRMYCMISSISSSNVDRQSSNPRAPPAVPMPVPDIPVSDDCEGSSGGRPLRRTSQSISVAPRTSRPLTLKDLKEPLQCETPCECCCHDTCLTRATPYWGSSWFGNLYLPRSFFHRSFASCNVQTCRRTQKNHQIAKIKWFFPLWFIAVDMKIRLDAVPVHFCLQTPRRVPETSTIFRYINRMDIKGVRELLVSGEASVNDVDEDGWGVLHYATDLIHYHSYEQVSGILQLLVDAGAHTEWEEYQAHQTPLQFLQECDSQKRLKSDIGFVNPLQTHIAGPIFHQDLIDTCQWEDWVDRCDFSDVHRAVLTHRTRNMSLKDMLSGTVADINAPCRQVGWTPLEWGIYMRIPNVVEAILECGADVHKRYPLHLAAGWGDVEALKLLVHAGADISLPDNDGRDGRTPLHEAAYYAQDRFVEELIRIGGDNLHLDVLNHYGNTALDTARTRREYYDEMGFSISGYDKIILVLSELQGSKDGRRTPERSHERTHAYIESVEDLCMPGSFPME